MTVGDEELVYAHHLELNRQPLMNDPVRDAHWHHEAQDIHMLRVIDAVLEAQSDAVEIAGNLPLGQVRFHLLHGYARRSKFIWRSMQDLYDLVEPARDKPLSLEDAENAGLALNTIYLNLRGMLDNLAWALLNASNVELPPIQVDIFRDAFCQTINAPALTAMADRYRDWSLGVKNLRDPVAHRIPLAVPPAYLDPHHEQLYREADARYRAAFAASLASLRAGNRGDDTFDETQRRFDELQKIGVFRPLFGHDPYLEHLPIYPTVPQDVGITIQISRHIFPVLRERLGQ